MRTVAELRPPGEGPVDHEAHPVRPGRGEHALRACERRGHGFFNETVEPALAGLHREILAEFVAPENVCGGEPVAGKQIVVGCGGFPGEAVAVFGEQRGIGVGGSDKFGAAGRGEFFEVAPDVVVVEAEGDDTVHDRSKR